MVGQVQRRLTNLKDRLQIVMIDDQSKVYGLEREISSLLEFDEIMWCQRLRQLWL